jgi:hypothetical protein
MGGRGRTSGRSPTPAYAAYRVLEYGLVTRSFVAMASPIAALSVRASGFNPQCRTRSSIWCWSTSTGTQRRP